ncbi:hypothetical protein ACFVU3_36335 [Streptomyces sp. NPDC058052]|uniref:hypothetical protein n=1 Tax=Streptomyces sp. NPDC058052 TaxID=3346316 RepID=UPI0036DFD668
MYLAVGDPATFDAPPDLGSDENYNRCLKWNGWLSKKRELFAVTPEVPVAMTVGTNDVAAITEIEGRVFTKRALPKQHFLLKCLHGAGDPLPFLAVADTVKQEVSVYRSEFGVLEFEGKMPPTSISLAGKADVTGRIALHSEYGYAYEGAIIVKLRRNGKEEVKVIGSPENPIRWVDNPCPPVTAKCPNAWGGKPAYGWNGSNWEKGFSPFPSEWGDNPSDPPMGPMD